MRGFRQLIFLGIFLVLLVCTGCNRTKTTDKEELIVWNLNSLKTIGGNSIELLGNPKLIDASDGIKATEFNGKDDGIYVNTNPIKNAKSFSIEVVFKPYDSYPANIEQRFLHIQDPNNKNRRMLIELRLNSKKQWYPDLYMKSENAALTLIDSTKTHPVNEWATIKLEYKNNQLKGYVNGVEELSGAIEYLPVGDSAIVSLGTRMDKRSWFNGAIREVRFSKEL